MRLLALWRINRRSLFTFRPRSRQATFAGFYPERTKRVEGLTSSYSLYMEEALFRTLKSISSEKETFFELFGGGSNKKAIR
jgi:hypothetical protein